MSVDGSRAGTHVLVTGASRGVGRAVALRLAGGGAQVLGVYRSAKAQADAVVEAAGGRVTMLAADLASEAGVQALIAQAQTAGPLHGAVFNAGISLRAPFTELKVEGVDPIDAQLDFDLAAPLKLLRALLRAEALRPDASVVFVSSNLARHGLENKVAYAAAKAGIEGAVRALAVELGPLGMRVNAVAPGLLRTDMTAAAGEAGYQAYANEVPLGRVGEAQDISPAIAFLLGPGAAYISGQVLDIDGGWGSR